VAVVGADDDRNLNGSECLPEVHRGRQGLQVMTVHGGFDMTFVTATSLVSDLRSGRTSAREALDQALERIDSRDAELNAIVVRDFERARAAAAAADAALARGERGALLGVPMTVKESFNVASLPTTWGIPGIPLTPVQQDAVAVSRLKGAGAVILGKSNVPTSLADSQCSNPVYGRTCNPWDLARAPGGSSGGSAAALAAGLISLELGSDMGGSLRFPAHCCGVFSHKPTYALVPMRGHAPPGTPQLTVGTDPDLAVVGPLARSAEDLMLALEVLAGPDDQQAVGYRLALSRARHASLGEFKVLLVHEHPFLPLSAEVRTAIERFADELRRTGCAVETSSPLLPDLALVSETFMGLLQAQLGAFLPEALYADLVARVGRARAENDSQGMRSAALVASHREWMLAHHTRTGLAHQWRQLFLEWDLVLCPVMSTPALLHDETEPSRRHIDIDGRSVPYMATGAWAALASLCGLPATTMPIGLGSSGLPVGIQIIGPYLEDRSTLMFAALAEREVGGFQPPTRQTRSP
jgi:amidase